jgi:hypothetical protein
MTSDVLKIRWQVHADTSTLVSFLFPASPCVKLELALSSTVVTMCTTYFDIKTFCILPTQCVVKRWRYPRNRPWRPIGLWDVEAPTFSRQSAHRWRWSCQTYAPAALHPQEDSWYSFLWFLNKFKGRIIYTRMSIYLSSFLLLPLGA